jgi:hypothetical protein
MRDFLRPMLKETLLGWYFKEGSVMLFQSLGKDERGCLSVEARRAKGIWRFSWLRNVLSFMFLRSSLEVQVPFRLDGR